MLSATPRGAAHSSTSSCSSAAALLLVVVSSFSGPRCAASLDHAGHNAWAGGLPRWPPGDALEASGSWRPSCTQRDWAERPSVCEPDFRQRVSGALSTVGTILQGTRTPTLAEVGTNHTYSDKYELSEFLTNTAIAAQLNVLERMGLDSATLTQLREMSAARSVSLRLKSKEECRFAKEVETEHENHRQLVEEVQTVAPDDDGDVVVIEEKTTKRKVITKSTTYHWTYAVEYQLLAFAGNEPEAPVAVLQIQQGEETLVTSTKASPLPDVTIHEPGASHYHFLPCHSFSHTNLKSPCAEQWTSPSHGCCNSWLQQALATSKSTGWPRLVTHHGATPRQKLPRHFLPRLTAGLNAALLCCPQMPNWAGLR